MSKASSASSFRSATSKTSLRRKVLTHQQMDSRREGLPVQAELAVDEAPSSLVTDPAPALTGPTREERFVARLDDDWSDLEAESSCSGRSSILPDPRRRTGVSMDLATQRANEMLLSGKDALEKAGNMKRECKTEALESLQGLYEIVLSVSDSRSRHRVSLEQERTRAARELVRVERAHTKQIAALNAAHAAKLQEAQEVAVKTGATAEAILKWLNFELDGPLKIIAAINTDLRDLRVDFRRRVDSAPPAEDDGRFAALAAQTERLADSLRELMVDLDRWRQESVAAHSDRAEAPPPRGASASPPPPLGSATSPVPTGGKWLERQIVELRQILEERLPEHRTESLGRPELQEDINRAIQPVLGELRSLRSEVGDLSDLTAAQQAPPSVGGLGAEMALTGIREMLEPLKLKIEQLDTKAAREAPERNRAAAPRPGPATYSEVLRTTFPVMVESADPRHTSDDVLNEVKRTVDVVELGIGVSRVRKIRNQKVVVACDTGEGRALLQEALRKSGGKLTASPVAQRNPLLRLMEVAPDLSDRKLEEAVIKQNAGAISGTPQDGRSIKVIRRTRGRTDAVQNVIVEVSPALWQALQNRRIKLGYQSGVLAVDHSPLVQCYKCMGFGHMARECTKGACCGHCSGAHETRACGSRDAAPTCINCREAGLGGDAIAHPAYRSECPVWLRWDRLARAAVNYSS